MSAQAGILCADAQPVAADTLDALAAWNSARGPHAAGRFSGEGMTMLHWSLHVDRFDALEQQPLELADGSVLTWDGRLDNRDDLLLQVGHDVPAARTDVALVGAAIERWGLDACRRLIGDWSLALWQPAARSITLARDFVGNRTLHFLVRPTFVAYSTCLETLLAMFDLYGRIDEDYLTCYLVHRPPRYRTAYRDVLPVPPGHYIRLCPGASPSAVAFREFGCDAIRYRREEDYARHLRSVFADAVKGRLRSRAPVWAELSGGLDSSAVVSMAHRLVVRRDVDAPELRPISWVYPDAPASDESGFIDAMETFLGVRSTRLPIDRSNTLECYRDILRPFGNVDRLYQQMSALMAPTGGTVLMTGAMGDATMANDDQCWSQAEHLLQGHPWRFLVGCATWARRKRRPVWGMMREALQIFRPLDRRERAMTGRITLQFARERKVRDVPLHEALGVTPQTLARAESLAAPLPASLLALPYTKRLFAFHLWQSIARDGLASPDRVPLVRLTHPFADVRVIDFMLAIPETVRWKPHVSRALMRDALGTLLPPLIRDRHTKGNWASAGHKKFRSIASALQQEREVPRLIQLGFVEPRSWDTMLRRLIDGSLSAAGQAQKLLEVEAWLRTRNAVSRETSSGRTVPRSRPDTHLIPTLQ
jgi:asparagine synthase (glutamine-hydrolysing)